MGQLPMATTPTPRDFGSYYSELTSQFRLAAGSPAIDTGIDVGLAYVGSAPDYGALEYTPAEQRTH